MGSIYVRDKVGEGTLPFPYAAWARVKLPLSTDEELFSETNQRTHISDYQALN